MKKKAPAKKPSCAECGDDSSVLWLHAACHLNAPLRLLFRPSFHGQGLLSLSCYIPDCSRPVHDFAVREISLEGAVAGSSACDLCGDNNPSKLQMLYEGHAFTAPLQLEHRAISAERGEIRAYCYLNECKRLIATFVVQNRNLSIVPPTE